MASSASQAKTITLMVVALDEEVLIANTVSSIVHVARQYFTDFEVLLVNDGSTDRTGEIMEELAALDSKIRVIHNEQNIGLGASFQKALAQASLEYFMMLCGDGGLPADSLPKIFEKVGTADIIIPYMENLNKIKSPARYLLSRTYTTLLNCFFGQNLNYYNGLPVYRVDLLRQIRIKSTGFGFQGEIITKLLKAGCTYAQVQVSGSEMANRSRAVSLRNFVNVGKTLFNLFWEIALFNSKSVKR